jgi:hypothetical protein
MDPPPKEDSAMMVTAYLVAMVAAHVAFGALLRFCG